MATIPDATIELKAPCKVAITTTHVTPAHFADDKLHLGIGQAVDMYGAAIAVRNVDANPYGVGIGPNTPIVCVLAETDAGQEWVVVVMSSGAVPARLVARSRGIPAATEGAPNPPAKGIPAVIANLLNMSMSEALDRVSARVSRALGYSVRAARTT